MTNSQSSAAHRNGLLFLCVGNGTRSQMAEAFARFIGPSDYTYHSAGTARGGAIDALAIKAMREVGVDISPQRSKTLADIPLGTIATVISLCEEEERPNLPEGVLFLSWPLPDPIHCVEGEEELIQAYRRVRDQIRELVSRLF